MPASIDAEYQYVNPWNRIEFSENETLNFRYMRVCESDACRSCLPTNAMIYAFIELYKYENNFCIRWKTVFRRVARSIVTFEQTVCIDTSIRHIRVELEMASRIKTIFHGIANTNDIGKYVCVRPLSSWQQQLTHF